MGALWTPEAIDLKPSGWSGTMSGVGGPRATAHVTVSPSGTKIVDGKADRDGWFWAMHRVLTGKQAEPHYLYDPLTDKLGQYFALDKSARALARSNFLPYSHNKVGKVNIQVEVVADTGDFTRNWKPGPNFRAMMRDIRSHGIADRFIFRVADTAADRPNVVRPNRLLTSADGGGLWWGHCHYGDGESHWDPDCEEARFFAAGKPLAPKPPPPVIPPTTSTPWSPDMFFVRVGSTSPVILITGTTARWIEDPADYARWQKVYATNGLPLKVAAVDTLDGLATSWEGPRPVDKAGAPIKIAGIPAKATVLS